MRKILVLGAGKSATSLIHYLIKEATALNAHLIIVDQDVENTRKKTGNSASASVHNFDIQDAEKRGNAIAEADLVLSLLPAALHLLVAKDCIIHKKSLLTPSYLSPEIQTLKKEIDRAGILLMGEMGLDPGIDHMSAMKALGHIREKGGKITSFQSFCGALVAPESDDNPWHYKISWSPGSLITSGKEGAAYRKNGEIRTLPYKTLFGSYKTLAVPGMGKLAYYPNRDSLRYAKLYGLEEIPSLLRATFRHPDFCEGWQTLVSLGLTDSTKVFNTDRLTYKEWLLTALSHSHLAKEKVKEIQDSSQLLHKQLAFLGLLSDQFINKGTQSAGALLFDLVSEKLALKAEDKDLIVLLHRITYKSNNEEPHTFQSLLKVKGDNSMDTAISKTVGLPLGILAKLLLTGKIKLTGLHIPTLPEIYLPVLNELKREGIRFVDY